MPRPQFTLRALLVAIWVVAAFFGGIRFEQYLAERRKDAIRLQITSESEWFVDGVPVP